MFKFISLTFGHVMNQAYVSKYDETFDDETSDRKQGSDSHAQPEVPSIWRKNMHQEKKNCPWYFLFSVTKMKIDMDSKRSKFLSKGRLNLLANYSEPQKKIASFFSLPELQEFEVRAKFPIMGK